MHSCTADLPFDHLHRAFEHSSQLTHKPLAMEVSHTSVQAAAFLTITVVAIQVAFLNIIKDMVDKPVAKPRASSQTCFTYLNS